MLINISEVVKNKAQKTELAFEIKSNEVFEGDSEVYLEGSLNFVGSLFMIGDILNVEGKVTGILKLVCSRCLEEYQYPLELNIQETFSLVPNDEDDSIIFIDRDNINLIEIIENNILMSLPIKKLCRKDCKGLCQVCGVNLNETTCDCENRNVDPRLANLKDLFLKD